MKHHGMSKTRFYICWTNMMSRCFYKNRKDSHCYMERGIKPCNEWLNFRNFKSDMYSSYLKHVKKHGEDTSLDRIDNNKGYSFKNCRWATTTEQIRNRRLTIFFEYKGKKRTIREISKLVKLSHKTLYYRINHLKWSPETAFSKKKIPPGDHDVGYGKKKIKIIS